MSGQDFDDASNEDSFKVLARRKVEVWTGIIGGTSNTPFTLVVAIAATPKVSSAGIFGHISSGDVDSVTFSLRYV